jgi:hypothetical protein
MERVLLDDRFRLLREGRDGTQSVRYARVTVPVPAAATRLRLTVSFESAGTVQLPVALFDPAGRIRLLKASEPGNGPRKERFQIGRDGASEGGIPGPLQPGAWRLVLYKRLLPDDLEVRLLVTADLGGQRPAASDPGAEPADALSALTFSGVCLNHEAGWYCGELHLHSRESTGRTSVAVIHETARTHGLDFIAVSDHLTASHWLRLEELDRTRGPLLMQSMEVSGERGHATVHGLTEWVNPFVDDNAELGAFLGMPDGYSMETIADRVHRQGGLFCINHPLSGSVAWRYRDFPMAKADLLEVVCLPDGSTSFLYSTLWDRFLCGGMRLTGVGSSDSHDPHDRGPWAMGRIRNWVRAESLCQAGILAGLKAGCAYVSVDGARLDFTARTAAGGERPWQMGETALLARGERCRFRAELVDHPSGNLFIVQDGMLADIRHLPGAGAREVVEFELDLPRAPGTAGSYVRLEFHEDLEQARYIGMAFRDHRSIRLLSNPIWLRWASP